VYYGRCERGKWLKPDPISAAQGGSGDVKIRTPLLTIVSPRPVFVRLPVAEKYLPYVWKGLEGRVVPSSDPEARISTTVASLTTTQVTPGHYEARLELPETEVPDSVVAGMAAQARFMPYRKAGALVVPASAVFYEPLDRDKRYVCVFADGEHAKRFVKVGKQSGKKLEILEGLEEGELILQKKPNDD
jgi:hypothetical protein